MTIFTLTGPTDGDDLRILAEMQEHNKLLITENKRLNQENRRLTSELWQLKEILKALNSEIGRIERDQKNTSFTINEPEHAGYSTEQMGREK